MTENKVQSIANKITEKYNVPEIRIEFSSFKSTKGQACYITYKLRGYKTNHPKYICVYNWLDIQNYIGEVSHIIGHELAHHIQNCKYNSLRHNDKFYELADKLGYEFSKLSVGV